MAEPPFVPRSVADTVLGLLPKRVQHLSASQLKMVTRCPEQYRRRYIKREKEAPNSNLVWGSADHAAVEHNFRVKQTTERDVPVADVELRFAEELDRRVDEAGGPESIEWKGDAKDKTAGVAHAWVKDRGVQLVRAYRVGVAPMIQPVTIEEEFELHVDGVPVPIIGRIDLEVEDARGTGLPPFGLGSRFVERKTRTPSQQKPSGEDRLQGEVYQLVRPLPIDFHLSLKSPTPKIVGAGGELRSPVAPVARTHEKIRRAATTIAFCWAAYGPDQPWPDALTHPWACGFCGFRPTCPWWTGQEGWPEKLW